MRLHHLPARDAVLHLRLALHLGVCRTHMGHGCACESVRALAPARVHAHCAHTCDGGGQRRTGASEHHVAHGPALSTPGLSSLRAAWRMLCDVCAQPAAEGLAGHRREGSRRLRSVEPRVSRGVRRGGTAATNPNLDQPPGWLKSRARRQERSKPRQDASKGRYPDGAKARARLPYARGPVREVGGE